MSSNPKEIIFEEVAREKLKKGINVLADAVSVTLGPKGRNVGIASWAMPKITNDGNSVTDEIELKDSFEDMGVQLAKEAAAKIKQSAGDGTTTGIVLLRSIVNEGMKNITSGASAIGIKRGLEKGLDKLLGEIDKLSKKIKTDEEIKNIATVSASSDETIGSDIAAAFKLANSQTSITIESGNKNETEIELVEGMEIERGYLSPYFCTDPKKMIVEMTNPKILITDKKINSIQDLLPILQTATSTSQELIIIADELDSDALATLVINNLKKVVKVAAIKTPGFGDKRKQMLEDLAHLVGGTYITEDKGLILKEASFEELGSAEKIIISKDKTLIINGKGKNIQKRIDQLEKEIENTKDNLDREDLEKRIAKLKGGVVIIKVGAGSDSELKQKKQKYEDSLNATKAGIEDGIVPGGGICLLRLQETLNNIEASQDEAVGINILKKALKAPIKQIISNAGFDHHLIIDEILQKKSTFGFDVIKEKVTDFIETGIIDPAKVVKSYLINAISIAKVILLSDALIADAKEEEK
ncbi:MAG: 60 kDa chaperonin [Candidatus Anoxychlamydiales bacterium]|nr:60 kDa chaperonin [Candidatus Anoxychlamydiales bacterium]NGX36154.1 60 kDa chaperonin [Candidatus Anoxychlamydiales bacterium]